MCLALSQQCEVYVQHHSLVSYITHWWATPLTGELVYIIATHYRDIMMTTMASQITSLTIVCSTVYSGADQRKTSKLLVTGICAGNSTVTGEFPAQRCSNTESVSNWWRHHVYEIDKWSELIIEVHVLRNRRIWNWCPFNVYMWCSYKISYLQSQRYPNFAGVYIFKQGKLWYSVIFRYFHNITKHSQIYLWLGIQINVACSKLYYLSLNSFETWLVIKV